MRRFFGIAVMALAGVTLSASSAFAWRIHGYVKCDADNGGYVNSVDIRLPNVPVFINGVGGTVFSASAVTNELGEYDLSVLQVDGTYEVTITPPNGATILLPAAYPPQVFVSSADVTGYQGFLLSSGACSTPPPEPEAKCWLTGGGAKFSPVTGTLLAEHGPQHSFGGNVNPSCSETSGEGGQWNHIAHRLGLHFQGWQIEVVRCGNVEEIPPGSESPVTPYNFLEFQGTGTLKGIKGNKLAETQVQFFARAEDRNEPGSSGQHDGAYIDRYFLHVFSGTETLLLIDIDGNPLTVDPVTITDGNLQIHISSCETP